MSSGFLMPYLISDQGSRYRQEFLTLTKHDPRLDNPSKEIINSIPWNDLPRQEVVNNIAKILSSPLLPDVLGGGFTFLDNIIREQDIKFSEIHKAHHYLTLRPWGEIIREKLQKIQEALGLKAKSS